MYISHSFNGENALASQPLALIYCMECINKCPYYKNEQMSASTCVSPMFSSSTSPTAYIKVGKLGIMPSLRKVIQDASHVALSSSETSCFVHIHFLNLEN